MYRYTGVHVQVYRCTGVQVYRCTCTGIHMNRCTGIQVYVYTCIPVQVHEYRYRIMGVIRCSGTKELVVSSYYKIQLSAKGISEMVSKHSTLLLFLKMGDKLCTSLAGISQDRGTAVHHGGWPKSEY